MANGSAYKPAFHSAFGTADWYSIITAIRPADNAPDRTAQYYSFWSANLYAFYSTFRCSYQPTYLSTYRSANRPTE